VVAGQGEQSEDRVPGDLVPRPDPTVLTTQLVDRALAAYREVVETRLRGMDRATELVAENVAKTGVDSDRKVEHLREDVDRHLVALREWLVGQVANVSDVSGERFSAIDTRFEERDARTAQAADDSRISLDAALAAAKEAVSEQNKANTQAIAVAALATKEQIASLITLTNSNNRALDDKISDLKTRMDRGEGRSTGLSAGWGYLVAAVGLIGVAIAIIARF
jgi:hypothetical protein